MTPEIADECLTLYDELKGSATFLSSLTTKCGMQNDRIEFLAEQIQKLCLTLPPINASPKLVDAIVQVDHTPNKTASVVSNTTNRTPLAKTPVEENLYWALSDARDKTLQSEASCAELGQHCVDMQEEYAKCQTRIAELEAAKAQLEEENQMLKEQNKENQDRNLPPLPMSAVTLTDSSNTSSTNVQSAFSADSVKTVDDFIEVFDALFQHADQLVQIIKRLGQADAPANFQLRALEESRNLRQAMNDVLAVFRRAKTEPKMLGNDLTQEVAAELKRIYNTMKIVKDNAEHGKRNKK